MRVRVRVSPEDPMRVGTGVRRLVVMAFALPNRVSLSWRFPFVGAVAVYPPPGHLYRLVVSFWGRASGVRRMRAEEAIWGRGDTAELAANAESRNYECSCHRSAPRQLQALKGGGCTLVSGTRTRLLQFTRWVRVRLGGVGLGDGGGRVALADVGSSYKWDMVG
jgi:hypothetical protein